MRILRGVAEESDDYNGFLRLRCVKVSLRPSIVLAHEVMPSLGYPGGRSAFFADLHLDFSRWLRLIALVPLVHASIEGLSYEELCFHILSILPSSNPPNVLIVSVDCIRSSVSEMLFNEPFFICSPPDNRSPSLSTSHWTYESSFDSDPSRISFAFSILRFINLSPGLSVRDALFNLTSVSLSPSSSISVSNESRSQKGPPSLCDVHGYSPPPPRSPSAAVHVSVPFRVVPPALPARAGLDSPNQQKPRFPTVLGLSVTSDPFRPCGPLYLPHGSVLIPMGLTASGEILHPDHVSSHLPQSCELPQRFYSTPEHSGTNSLAAERADSVISTQHKASTSVFQGHLNEPPSYLSVGRCDSPGNSYARIPLFLPSQTPIRDPSQNTLSPQGSGLTHEGKRLSQCSPVRCTGQPRTDSPRSDVLHTSPLRRVELEVCFDVEREWPDRTATDACPPMLSAEAESKHGPPHYQSANLSNDLGRKASVSLEAIPTRLFQAPCDIEPSETLAPKETRPPTPDHANEHEKMVPADRRRTHPMNTANNGSPISHPDGSCALLTPTSSDPKSRPRRPPSFLGTSRPSVIVYKVATGPNFSGSRDVIRVSYGEGHRKRTPLTNSSNRSRERILGRHGYSTKEYGITKGDDTTEHLNRKSMRSKHCSLRRYHNNGRSPSGLRKTDIKMSGMLSPAERVEGDMAWDFGAGPETCVRPVDADRSRVRVGGLTSVRMIPRTAVNGGIGPEAISTTS